MNHTLNDTDCLNIYDYIIVGAGPTGLTLAWLLAQEPTVHRILVLERANSIGGCHRVDRDPTTNLFTEHGPRIYSTTYVNVIQILSSMDINFFDLFGKYDFTHGSMSQEVLKQLTPAEIFKLGIEYVKLVFDPAYGLFTTVSDFLEINEFSKVGKDVIGKICRLTDGAGPERYNMNQLLHGFDHHVFYKFMQPKLPNDIALFPLWQDRLYKTNKVDIWTSADVKSLDIPSDIFTKVNNSDVNYFTKVNNSDVNYFTKDSSIKGVTLTRTNNLGTTVLNIKGKNVILAIPPEHALRISGLSYWTTNGRVFSSNPKLNIHKASVENPQINTISISEFGNLAKYDYYLPIVFHYPWTKKELNLPKIWGFPSTDWGVITILLSEYMDFNDNRSKTVITSAISLTDIPSTVTGLTANQTTDPIALMREVFRQVNIIYNGTLPEPYFGLSSVIKDIPITPYKNNNSIDELILSKGIMLISPGVSYDPSKKIWINSDSAFINTPASGHLPDWENADVPGLFWVGSLNGQSYYNFSSMESAMSNAIAFYLSKYHNPKFTVRSSINFSTVLRSALLILLIIIIFKYLNTKA